MSTKNTSAKLSREQRAFLLNKMSNMLASAMPKHPDRPRLGKSITVSLPVTISDSRWSGDPFDLKPSVKPAQLQSVLPAPYKEAVKKYETAFRQYCAKAAAKDRLLQRFEEELVFIDSDLTALNTRMAEILAQFKQ